MTAIHLQSSKVSALLWAGLIALASLVGLASGVPFWLVCLVAFGLLLPVVLGVVFGNLGLGLVPLRVLSWTLVATLATAATGAGTSPLVLLFLLGPLDALARGERRVAIELTVFALAAYVAVAISGGLLPSLLPQPVPGLYLGLLTFSTLVQAVFLAGLAFVGSSATAPLEAVGADEPVGGELSDGSLVLPALPDSLGLLLVSVSEHGRIRAVDGKTEWSDRFSVGQIADLTLAGMGVDPKSDWVRSGGRGTCVLDDRTRLDLHVRRGEAGRLIALAEAMDTNTTGDGLPQDVREAVAARTAFFASLGHDLKTPLNAIIGFADMMRAGVRGPVPDAYSDYVEIIHESGNDLLLLVEDILDLAKADAERLKLDLEPVDLVASANSVMRQLEAQAIRAGVKLERAGLDEAWAEADARAVRQIWQNLISNAIKYSPQDGVVTIEVRADQDGFTLAVEDHGIGMDEADLARLAEPFVQGGNSAGRLGTGLGLAVVKQYAELHGGQVRIETAPDAGTRVEVSFKASDARVLGRFDRAAQ